MVQRADAGCCLSDLGSLKTPTCVIRYQREAAMAKGGEKGVDSPPGACVGRSLLEMLEDELDEKVDWLNDVGGSQIEMENVKGQAMGLATSIAIIRAPYCPNVESVRQDAGWRRGWREEQKAKKAAESSPSWSETGSRASEVEEAESGE